MRKLSANTTQRVLELQQHLNQRREEDERLTFEDVIEWAVLRSYNRQRAVKRHSLSLKNQTVEVSPLEERGTRGIDDE